MHQRPLLLARSVLANVGYVLRLHGKPPDGTVDILRKAGMDDITKRHANDLSLGMQRRLALARVLASDAPLVLLDEPYANLDAAGKLLVTSLANKMAAEGRAVVVACQHDEGTVRDLGWQSIALPSQACATPT